MKLKSIVLFSINLIILNSLYSQQDFIETEYVINDICINKTRNSAWFTSQNKIFKVDLDNFKISDSVKVAEYEQVLTSLVFFDSEQKVLKINSFNINTNYRSLNQEYPKDTTYYVNIDSLKVISRVAGNVLFSNANSDKNYAIGLNNYQNWKDSLGYSYNFSRKGFIGSFKRPNVAPINQAQAPGIIKDIRITQNNLIVIGYNIREKDREGVLLEIRDFPGLELISSQFIAGEKLLNEVLVADNEKTLILSTSDYNQTYLDYFSIPELDKFESMPEGYTYENLIENGKLWYLRDRDVVLKNLNSGENLIEIWNNLTPFWMIKGFAPYKDEAVLIYGQKSTNPNIPGGKTGLFLYNLEDNAIYSGKKQGQEDLKKIVQLIPDETQIQNNRLLPENSNIQTKTTEKYLLFLNERRLQIWGKDKKRKLYDLKFDNEIAVFPGKSEDKLLIFKKVEDKYGDEFQLIDLDLKSGKAKQKEFANRDNFTFSGNPKFYNISSKNNIWLGTNGDSKLWQLDLEKSEFELLKDFSDENSNVDSIVNSYITQLLPISNSEFLINFEHREIDENYNHIATDKPSPKLYDYQNNSFTNTKLENTTFLTDHRGCLIYQENKNIYFHKPGENSKPLNFEISNPNAILENVLSNSNQTYLITSTGVTDSTKIYILNSKFDSQQSFKLHYSFENFFLSKNEISFTDDHNFYSYSPELEEIIAWGNLEEYYVNKNSYSIANNKILFDNRVIIDLTTLETVSFPSDLHFKRELLENGNILEIYSEAFGSEKPYFQFRILSGDNYQEIKWKSKKFNIIDYEPNSIKLSGDNKYAAIYYASGYGSEKRFFLLDLESKEIKEKKLDFEVGKLFFPIQKNVLSVSSQDDYNPKTNQKTLFLSLPDLKNLKEYNFPVVGINENENFFTLAHESVVLSDGKMDLKIYNARDFLSVAEYLPGKNIIVAGSHFGNLFIWNENVGSPQSILNLGTSEIIDLITKGDRLFVLLKNGNIQIVDLNTQELIITLHLFEQDGKTSIAWISPDGYFKADKKSIRNFHFVSVNQSYPLSNYEIFLHRPDILMQKLGYADSESINIYQEAYQKRLKRNGFDEVDKLKLKELPELYLANNDNIPSVTDQNSISLSVRSDEIEKLHSIKAYINGVPVSTKNAGNLDLTLELNSGKNSISIVGFTSEGLQTNPISLDINYITDTKKPKLYYFGIGVSKYEETSMNLKYADVDVKTIAENLKFKFKDRIEIDTLNNANATKENILALKSKLKNTGINDIVIISFSGHGLVGEDNQFYFATHQTDFNAPETSALNYDKLYDLLSDIPARKKLLLIDACNSGELDPTELQKDSPATNDKVVTYIPEGAKGSKVVKSSSKSGKKTSFQIMQSQFYDLDRGNGSYIISAAGGREFAYESEEWGNGVFTYSFLNALDELRNVDFGGQVTPIKISDLSEKIYKMVLDLTDGKQKPTSRSENIEWDWEIK